MAEIIKNGITHRGFALIDVLSPCVTFNSANRYDWYRKRVYKIDQDHDPTNHEGFAKAAECDTSNWEKIPLASSTRRRSRRTATWTSYSRRGRWSSSLCRQRRRCNDILKEYL